MSTKSKQYFRLRAFPNLEDHYEDFIKHEFVALGWPLTDILKTQLIGKLDLSSEDFSAQSIADNVHNVSDYLRGVGGYIAIQHF